MTSRGRIAAGAGFGILPALLRFLGLVAGPILVAFILATPALGQNSADPKLLFDQLNDASLDPSEVYVIRNAHITRDRVNIYLNRGFVGFFAPVGGEITGAIFVGDGEVLMMPRDTIERASLARFTQAGVLNERFTSAYFRFTDQTARELVAGARRPEPEDLVQPGDFVDRWKLLIQKLNLEYSMRILLDLMGERDKPCFLAYLQGSTLGTFQVEVDERVPEAVQGIGRSQTYGAPSPPREVKRASMC